MHQKTVVANVLKGDAGAFCDRMQRVVGDISADPTCFLMRSDLRVGSTGRHTHHHFDSGLEKSVARGNEFDQTANHHLAGFVIRDDTFPEPPPE